MSRVGRHVHDARASLGTVFANPNLRRVILAFGGSAIGDWAYGTAIMVWAYGVGGVTAVGVWATLRLVLVAIVGPFASTLADRYSRKAVMVGADLARAVLVLVCALLITVDAPALSVFVVATLASLAGTPFHPSLAALLPRLATKPAELTAANGAVSTVESVAFFVGPAIGALLLGFTSVQVVVLFNALTFLWSAALVVRVHESREGGVTAPDGDPDDEAGESFLTESMAGFKEIGHRRDLLLITGIYAAQTLVAGASFVFGVAIAVEMTPFGARGVGYLDAALGVGAVLGGLVAIARANRQRLAADFSVGVLFWAIPLVLVAVWPHTGAALVAMVITGVANPVVDVNASTIIQRMTPDEVLGRVFGALESALILAMAAGSLIMPFIIGAVGLRWSLVVLAVFMLLVVVPTWPRMRRIDTTLRAPVALPLVEQSTLFAPLERKSLELIAGQFQRVEVAAGEVLIAEGQSGDRFYLVESG
jgi:MFS family permease